MALINTDWQKELSQVKNAAREIVEEQFTPMVQQAIEQAGTQLSNVVVQAGEQVQENIKVLSDELHNQRRLTREELITLIDYASDRLGKTMDDRISAAKTEASTFISEKLAQMKSEFEDAAIKSRKTLYLNIGFSFGAAVAMAVVGLVYKKISLGELDVFNLFRVLLISSAVGTGIFAALKAVATWRALNRTKKNIATTVLNYASVLRPNGAWGLFVIAAILVTAWLGLTFYI